MFVCRAFSLVRFCFGCARLDSASFGFGPHVKSVSVKRALFAPLSGLALPSCTLCTMRSV